MSLRSGMDAGDFDARGRDSLPGHLGIRVISIAEGKVVLALTVRPEVMAPNGFLHAGTVVTLADTAAGYATIAHLPEGAENFTTIELKVNFLGTVRQGSVRAEAVAVHLGRTTHVWDATVFTEDSNKAIAHFRCTQMILYPRAAKPS